MSMTHWLENMASHRSGAVRLFVSVFLVVILSWGAGQPVAMAGDEKPPLRMRQHEIILMEDQSIVVLAVDDQADGNRVELPLTWTVREARLGQLLSSSGLMAIYRRTATPGENQVDVRDPQGRCAIVTIRYAVGTAESSVLVATPLVPPLPDPALPVQPEPDPVAPEPPAPDPALDASAPVVMALESAEAELAALEAQAVPLIDETSGNRVRSDYTLMVGDELQLEIFREPDLSGTYRIEQGGIIRHALFGPVQVAGFTVTQAEASLTRYLDKHFLVNPRVTLRVVSSQASQVLVMGEVKTPGARQIPFDKTVTLLQIIAEAGGFTDLASVNRVHVIRKVDGRQKKIPVRVSRISSGAEPDVEIEPNDVIMVPQSFF